MSALPILMRFTREIKSLNHWLTVHWSKRAADKRAWVVLIRAQVAHAFNGTGHHAVVTFTNKRRRILDTDNYTGGLKMFRDALKATNLIRDDTKRCATFHYEQVRCSNPEEPSVTVSITYGAALEAR